MAITSKVRCVYVWEYPVAVRGQDFILFNLANLKAFAWLSSVELFLSFQTDICVCVYVYKQKYTDISFARQPALIQEGFVSVCYCRLR